MITAPIPLDEQERVAALRALKILDTPPEERFDRVTRLAAKLFDVPIAYVAMIDSTRQWFKSKQGLKACQTPRDISFCGHAVLQDEALVILDATQDERFSDNPMVTGEPFVRFYAGQSLKSADGQRVGTLCVVDRKPREFGDRDREILRELADMIEKELGLVDMIKLQSDFLTTKQKLIESQSVLAREIAEASSYVASLIPKPLLSGPVQTDWIYLPSSQLGGDALGYHPLEDDRSGRMVIYMLDVAGHGVGAALLATTVMSVLQSQSLAATDFAEPAEVLKALNRAFPMERHGGRCFSIWYGVYDPSAGALRYACAGHPPAFLAEPGKKVRPLDRGGIAIGLMLNADYSAETVAVSPGSTLGLYSDGAYEFKVRHADSPPAPAQPEGIESDGLPGDGDELGWDAWVRIFAERLECYRSRPEALTGLIERLRALLGENVFPDDISILTVKF